MALPTLQFHHHTFATRIANVKIALRRITLVVSFKWLEFALTGIALQILAHDWDTHGGLAALSLISKLELMILKTHDRGLIVKFIVTAVETVVLVAVLRTVIVASRDVNPISTAITIEDYA